MTTIPGIPVFFLGDSREKPPVDEPERKWFTLPMSASTMFDEILGVGDLVRVSLGEDFVPEIRQFRAELVPKLHPENWCLAKGYHNGIVFFKERGMAYQPVPSTKLTPQPFLDLGFLFGERIWVVRIRERMPVFHVEVLQKGSQGK